MLKLASVGAFAAVLGDVLMLSAAHGHAAPIFSADSTNVLLAVGGGAGALAILSYFWGYRAAAQLLPSAATRARRVVTIAGAVVAIFGTLTHGLTALDIQAALAAGRGVRPPAEAFAPSWSALFVCGSIAAAATLLAALLFAPHAWAANHRRIRTAAILNPIVVTLGLSAAGAFSDVVAAYLVPAAPNVAHLIFFSACAAACKDEASG